MHFSAFLAHTSDFVGDNCVKDSIVLIFAPVQLFPWKDQVMITLVKLSTEHNLIYFNLIDLMTKSNQILQELSDLIFQTQ